MNKVLPENILERLVEEHALGSQDVESILQSCHVLPPNFLYFQRLQNPTEQTIQFTTHLLNQVAEYHNISHLVWDLRNRRTIQTGLHRKILQKINGLYPKIQEISVVVDQQNLPLQLTLKFGARLSRLLNNPIHYSVYVNMENVLASA